MHPKFGFAKWVFCELQKNVERSGEEKRQPSGMTAFRSELIEDSFEMSGKHKKECGKSVSGSDILRKQFSVHRYSQLNMFQLGDHSNGRPYWSSGRCR